MLLAGGIVVGEFTAHAVATWNLSVYRDSTVVQNRASVFHSREWRTEKETSKRIAAERVYSRKSRFYRPEQQLKVAAIVVSRKIAQSEAVAIIRETLQHL